MNPGGPHVYKRCSCGYDNDWPPAFAKHLKGNPDHTQTDGPGVVPPQEDIATPEELAAESVTTTNQPCNIGGNEITGNSYTIPDGAPLTPGFIGVMDERPECVDRDDNECADDPCQDCPKYPTEDEVASWTWSENGIEALKHYGLLGPDLRDELIATLAELASWQMHLPDTSSAEASLKRIRELVTR